MLLEGKGTDVVRLLLAGMLGIFNRPRLRRWPGSGFEVLVAGPGGASGCSSPATSGAPDPDTASVAANEEGPASAAEELAPAPPIAPASCSDAACQMRSGSSSLLSLAPVLLLPAASTPLLVSVPWAFLLPSA